MNLYKVTFANNEISTVQLADQRFDHDSEYYYEFMGQIKYAMVIGGSEESAKRAAKTLVGYISRTSNHINPPMSAAA